MAIKSGKNTKNPGDALIGLGSVVCLLGCLLFILTIVGGTANGSILFGGEVLGLLMVCAGYLKRISVALTSKVDVPGQTVNSEAV